MGKEIFSSLKKTYEDLESVKDVPKHSYTFRIDASNIARVIEFLQQYLQVKPGCKKDVKVALNVFRRIPVYERDEKSIEILFVSYKGAYASYNLQIGEPTLNCIAKLLTKLGKKKLVCLPTTSACTRHHRNFKNVETTKRIRML